MDLWELPDQSAVVSCKGNCWRVNKISHTIQRGRDRLSELSNRYLVLLTYVIKVICLAATGIITMHSMIQIEAAQLRLNFTKEQRAEWLN